jgi:hypothetical protein
MSDSSPVGGEEVELWGQAETLYYIQWGTNFNALGFTSVQLEQEVDE